MKLSDGEKLIIAMLADMMRAGGVRGETDPAFIMEAIGRGHLWALQWKYSGLLSEDEEPSDQVVQETVDILNMCRLVEASIQQLGPEERDSLGREAQVFAGFDANDEPHYGVATMMIEHLHRWREFAGRDLNSHMPMLDRYRDMKAVFNDLRRATIQRFTLEEIQRIVHPQG